MLVLGIQGSPRKKGNSDVLLTTFLKEAEKRGAVTVTVDTERRDIVPCKELIVCEKKGYCPIEDDMQREIYPLIRRADVIVAATPVFFYNMTAQLKALIDRCQTFWSLKYRFRLADPNAAWRRAFLLSVAATRGKNLFGAIDLTMKYFCDAVDAAYAGSLTYPGVEARGEIRKHPGLEAEIARAAETLLAPFEGRRTLLFVGRTDSCRSRMAAAFARRLAGDRFDVLSGGTHPAGAPSMPVVRAMADAGIDIRFSLPRPLEEALAESPPDRIVALDPDIEIPGAGEVETTVWSLPPFDPADETALAALRDEIRERVEKLLAASG